VKKYFPHYTQLDAMDCGPTCLRMIAKHHGRSYTLQTLRERSFNTREGVSMLGISDAAESIGMHTQRVRINFEQLVNDALTLCILHWNQNYIVVCYGISKQKRGLRINPTWEKLPRKSQETGQFSRLYNLYISNNKHII
jgi:ATP-binding cassette subfamily B protein